MAPIVSEEALSRDEYLELVGSTYGPAIAREIGAARLAIQLGFPQPVRAVRGGRVEGGKARFDTPLVDLLVLETPLIYEIEWGRP